MHAWKILLISATLATALYGENDDAKTKTVKVFVLAGQSNMVGHGKVEQGLNPAFLPERKKGVPSEIPGGPGSLRHLATAPETKAKFGHHLDKNGRWVVRQDVYINANLNDKQEKGKLTTGFGKGNWFGPELEFGHVLGDYLDEPVLIIKAAWGGRDLAVDFRSPSSGPKADKRNREVGQYYRKILNHVHASLANFETDFPELKGYKPEMAGFGWHQGYNDGVNKEYTAEYEVNLAHFIRDMRKDLKVEKLPFVIGNTGLKGFAGSKGNFAVLCQAQLNVGDPEKHPEFEGTIISVETRSFHRPREVSPSHMGHHWYHNAEPHFLVGEAMGKAMVKLMAGNH